MKVLATYLGFIHKNPKQNFYIIFKLSTAPYQPLAFEHPVIKYINPLSARPLSTVIFLKNYSKFDFVTHFSGITTELQSFVYHFVGNIKLLKSSNIFLEIL